MMGPAPVINCMKIFEPAIVYPSAGLVALNAGKPSRSPEGTTQLAALSRKLRHAGRLGAARRSA
jgi:hypothetical protein